MNFYCFLIGVGIAVRDKAFNNYFKPSFLVADKNNMSQKYFLHQKHIKK